MESDNGVMTTVAVNRGNQTIPYPLDWAYTVVEVAVASAATCGNLLVILVFLKFDSLKTVTNYYVLSLAMADLLVGLIGIPCAVAVSVGLPENFQACLFMSSLLMLLCTSSILSLVAITVDRLWAIMHPLRYPAIMTKRRALYVIALCWSLASLIGLLPSMGWNKGRPYTPSCFFMEVIDLRYLVFIYFATILAPSAFMAYVYLIIFQAVSRQVQRLSRPILQTTLPEMDNQQNSLKSQAQAAKNIAVIVLLFVISWMPLYTLNTIMCFCPDCRSSTPPMLLKFCIILSHLNSVWNPALYAWGMRDFREALLKLLGFSTQNNVIHKLVERTSNASSQRDVIHKLVNRSGTVV